MTTQLCRRCQFHPASDRIFGYCSWDCHDADDDQDHDQDRRVAAPQEHVVPSHDHVAPPHQRNAAA
jgi:hypothetical protein